MATALLPLNLILQILLLPIYIVIFAGALVDLNPVSLLESVLWVLFIPLVAAAISRHFLLPQKGKAWFERLSVNISISQVLSLNLAIIAIFASEGNALIQQTELFLKLFIPIVAFFLVNFYIAYCVGQYLRFSYEEFACFSCTTLARNSPLSLAIAASAFPHKPLISLTLVIGPLIELPIMILISQSLLRIQRNGQWSQ